MKAAILVVLVAILGGGVWQHFWLREAIASCGTSYYELRNIAAAATGAREAVDSLREKLVGILDDIRSDLAIRELNRSGIGQGDLRRLIERIDEVAMKREPLTPLDVTQMQQDIARMKQDLATIRTTVQQIDANTPARGMFDDLKRR